MPKHHLAANATTLPTSNTMSSLEIADLLGPETRHDNVKRTIERLANRGAIELPPLEEVKNHLGQTVEVYLVGKRDSYVIVAQLSPEFTAKLVDRWQELEESERQRQIEAAIAHTKAIHPAPQLTTEVASRHTEKVMGALLLSFDRKATLHQLFHRLGSRGLNEHDVRMAIHELQQAGIVTVTMRSNAGYRTVYDVALHGPMRLRPLKAMQTGAPQITAPQATASKPQPEYVRQDPPVGFDCKVRLLADLLDGLFMQASDTDMAGPLAGTMQWIDDRLADTEATSLDGALLQALSLEDSAECLSTMGDGSAAFRWHAERLKKLAGNLAKTLMHNGAKSSPLVMYHYGHDVT